MWVVLFLALGIIDVYAEMALIFKSFKIPYFEYFKEISIMAIFIALVSLIIREFLELSALADIILHFALIILFLRYIIKVIFWRSIIVSLSYFSYGLISFLSYTIYASMGIETDSAIQVTQIVGGFLIAWLLYRFNVGFSWFSQPPHDFLIKAPMKKADMQLIVSVLFVAALFFVGFEYVWNYQLLEVVPFILAGFSILIYMGYKRDVQR